MALMGEGGALIVLFAVGGCATYQPVPMTSEAVDAQLQPPDMAELRMLASEIDHPILQPVKWKPDDGLTPEVAAVLAVLLNPSLRAARDQRALAGAQLLDAGLLPDPELSYSLETPTGGDTAGKVNAFGLGLSWEVTSLVFRSARVDGSRANQEAVDLDIAWQEWQVAQAARAAVYQLASLQDRTALAEEVSRQAARNLERIRKAVAAGTMTAGSLDAARTAGRRAEENLLDLEKQAERQRLQLRRLLGLPSDGLIRLSDDIHLPSRVDPPALAALLEGLEKRRLDLLALRRGYDSQEAAVRAAILKQFPKIVIGPTLSRDTDNLRTTGFALSVELPIFNRHQGEIARERASRRMLFDEYANRLFETRSDIGLVLSGMRFLNEQIGSARASEAGLERLVESYRAALEEGRTDALIYFAAWNELADARMKILALKGELAQAVTALQLATGFYEIPKPDWSPRINNTEEGNTP